MMKSQELSSHQIIIFIINHRPTDFILLFVCPRPPSIPPSSHIAIKYNLRPCYLSKACSFSLSLHFFFNKLASLLSRIMSVLEKIALTFKNCSLNLPPLHFVLSIVSFCWRGLKKKDKYCWLF